MSGLRRLAAALAVLVFGAATGWLLAGAARPERLPAGAALPALGFRGEGGAEVLDGGADRTIVIWFHTRCPHCVSQLDALERDRAGLAKAHLYLLSSEDSLFSGPLRSRWPGLVRAGNVTWGIVDPPRFSAAFGTSLTPSLFVFGPQGNLLEKYVGEVSPAMLVAPLDPSPVRDGTGPAPPGVGEPRDRTACAHPDASRCENDPSGRKDDA